MVSCHTSFGIALLYSNRSSLTKICEIAFFNYVDKKREIYLQYGSSVKNQIAYILILLFYQLFLPYSIYSGKHTLRLTYIESFPILL